MSSARVVLRSSNNANTNAGVSYANANNDAANTNAWNGSRLALKALNSLKTKNRYSPSGTGDVSPPPRQGREPRHSRPQDGTPKHHAQGWSLVGSKDSRITQVPEK